MTSHADLPSEAEATSIDDLVADCVEVRAVLDASRPRDLPGPRRVIIIPDSAVAAVRDLDTYGD